MTTGGPYRAQTPTDAQPPPRQLWAWALGALTIAALLVYFWPSLVPTALEAADVPPELVDDLSRFPGESPDLPVATPLAPLLSADAPDGLAVLAPGEGGQRLRRGDALVVRFNRPMVAAPAVGTPLEAPPITFEPSVPGTARWITRSSLAFTPEPRAFDRQLEAHWAIAPGLTSVDGAALVDDLERVIVCDGTPRASEGVTTVAVGEPLEVHFDAPVSIGELAREAIVFERGGGARTLPVRFSSRGWVTRGEGEDAPRSFVVAVDLTRRLEPGAEIGVALAPRFSSWSTWEPFVLGYRLEPRPRIDGIACDDPTSEWADCVYDDAPGDIVDIGPELVLRASHPLVPGAGTAAVSPPVRGLTVSVDASDNQRARYVVVTADWEADQVYEVRLAGLTTVRGTTLSAPPLAVRSAGRTPEIRAPSGLLTFEHDAPLVVSVSSVHTEHGVVRIHPVAAGDAVAEALGLRAPPATDAMPSELPAGYTSRAMTAIVPGARANRWGRGRLAIDAPQGPAIYRVRFSADGESRGPEALLVRTDLGVSALSVTGGLLVWVSSIATSAPAEGVAITAHDAYGVPLAVGRTDGDGLAWLEGDALVSTRLVRAESASDRALLSFDPRAAVTGSTLEVYGGDAADGDDARVRAITRTDRGLYRPGETLHVVGLVRTVRGITLTPRADLPLVARLVSAGMEAPEASVEGRTSALGLFDATLPVPPGIPLGDARVELVSDGEVIGFATVRVAQYREPRFRVDIAAPARMLAGTTETANVRATYLFGSPASGSTASVRVVRGAHAPVHGHAGFVFAPVDAAFATSTLSESRVTLDGGGVALPLSGTLVVPARTELSIETDVTDPAGQSAAASRTIVVRPAEVEVGMAALPAWIRWGEPVEVEAVAIDGEDQPVSGASIEVRFSREGWHGYWEWHGGEDEGGYAMRRAQRRALAHTCTLTSEATPVTCTFSPADRGTRAGTYLVEVEARDAAGRRSLASQRVYVAGPDESPDRDPPGAPLEITPRIARGVVGGTVELAFECPWPEAEALIVVSQDRVLHTERRRVSAGGQVISVALTEAHAPNAFVTVTLIRPRTAPPGGELDLGAPDLRFGAAELIVRPELDPLTVRIDEARELRPGEVHELGFTVTDADGQPVEAELAVWASDEGTLRATGFSLGSLDEDLFARRAATFALDDLRRRLRSRLVSAIEGEPSGDGGSAASAAPRLSERERYEPTPLFVGRVRTDGAGRAVVPFHLPERLTEYRVMAIATDARARVGSATAARVVTRAVVVRPALPRFLTAGDEAELAAFVHNRTDAEASFEISFEIDGAGVRDAGTEQLVIPARSELAIRRRVVATEVGTLSARFVATGGGDVHAVTSEIAVVPRGRAVREHALVMGRDGLRTLELALPADASAGDVEVVVASHPFVGLAAMVDALDDAPWATAELDAARILALSSLAVLERGGSADDRRATERSVRLRQAIERMLGRQNDDGGIAPYPGEASEPVLTLRALEALLAAKDAGAEVDLDAVGALASHVSDDVHAHLLGSGLGDAGMALHVRALRLLGDAGHALPAQLDAAYETREFLSAEALFDLWLALDAGDARRTTVRALAEDRSGISRPHGRIALADRYRSARELAALVRAESVRRAHARPHERREIGTLLPLLGSALFREVGSGDPGVRAEALSALALLAARFVGPAAPPLALTVDGAALDHERTSLGAAHYRLPFAPLPGATALLTARRGTPGDDDHGPVFLATHARWVVPLSEADDQARGRGVALHRVFETPGGTPIPSGSVVHVGDLVRVRLFVHSEGWGTSDVAIRDPHLAGLEAIDAGLATSPVESLRSVLGIGPEDDAADPRAYHADRTAWAVRQVTHEAEATTFYTRPLGGGLAEVTYVVRATTAGRFVAPPAELELLGQDAISARSTRFTLDVVREAP